MSKLEKRSVSTPAKVEIRENGKPGSIYGYPIVYGKDSENIGFIERVAKGAAKKALKRSNIRALKNHDPSLIFGRQGVNLKLVEDDQGLRYEAEPISTRNFRDIAEEISAGLLTGQSFGFTVLKDEWSDLDKDIPRRTITEIGEIMDVGPVTYPAYNDTTVALRSMETAKSDIEFVELPIEIEIQIKGMSDNSLQSEFVLNFKDENEFRKYYDKHLRSLLSPSTAGNDSTDDGPTTSDSSGGDSDILESIKKLQRKWKQ